MSHQLTEVALSQTGQTDASDTSLFRAQIQNGSFLKVRRTTVDSANRIRDKERVERDLALSEFGSNHVLFFLARGYWEERSCDEWLPLTLVGSGYSRIVYGDHGPYVELKHRHVYWPTFRNEYFKPKPDYAYYDEYFCAEDYPQTMLYAQKKSVANKKNPPKSGQWSCDNDRQEGYANYIPGMYYIDCSKETLFCIDSRTGQPLGASSEKGEHWMYSAEAARDLLSNAGWMLQQAKWAAQTVVCAQDSLTAVSESINGCYTSSDESPTTACWGSDGSPTTVGGETPGGATDVTPASNEHGAPIYLGDVPSSLEGGSGLTSIHAHAAQLNF